MSKDPQSIEAGREAGSEASADEPISEEAFREEVLRELRKLWEEEENRGRPRLTFAAGMILTVVLAHFGWDVWVAVPASMLFIFLARMGFRRWSKDTAPAQPVSTDDQGD